MASDDHDFLRVDKIDPQPVPPAAPPPPVSSNGDHGRERAYALAALRGECERLAGTAVGRNDTLNAVAFGRLSGFVNAGSLSEAEVVDGLLDAGRRASALGDHPFTDTEIRKTLQSALGSGAVKGTLRQAPPRADTNGSRPDVHGGVHGDDQQEPDEPHPVWGYHQPVDGHEFLFGQPDEIASLWGDGDEILWMHGESFMIAGGMGLGKTTLAGQILHAQLCGGGEILGLSITPISGNILYLAMDRPRQIARSLRRQFDLHTDREALARLYVRPGPPPRDLAADPTLLCRMADDVDAEIVYVDSLKDAAIGLSKDEVGAAYNRARQFVLSHGRQICELHHNRKPTKDAPEGTVNEIYGSMWLTAGVGSIINLVGEPGDPIIEFRHVKQPLNEVGPFRLLNNSQAGLLTIEHEVDLLDLVDAAGSEGLTAVGAAAAMFSKERPTRAQEQKARRKLDRLTDTGLLVKRDGMHGGDIDRSKTAWFRAGIIIVPSRF